MRQWQEVQKMLQFVVGMVRKRPPQRVFPFFRIARVTRVIAPTAIAKIGV